MAYLSKTKGGYNPELRKSPIYSVWINMRSRCTNLKATYYEHYGGRGITVCDRWNLFKNFAEDMLPSFKDGLTLDRIDNEGNYCMENCRWANAKEQSLNRRSNRILEYKGEKKHMSKWAELSGVKPSTFRTRFYTYKWSLDKCLNYKS